MTKAEFLASRVRENARELTAFTLDYEQTPEISGLLRIASSLMNVAEELVKIPSPAFAPGADKRTGPKPTGLVKKLTPKPVIPSPAIAN